MVKIRFGEVNVNFYIQSLVLNMLFIFFRLDIIEVRALILLSLKALDYLVKVNSGNRYLN